VVVVVLVLLLVLLLAVVLLLLAAPMPLELLFEVVLSLDPVDGLPPDPV